MAAQDQSILLITNMYPDVVDPSKGVFVQNIVSKLEEDFARSDVVALGNARDFAGKSLAYLSFYSKAIRHMVTARKSLVYVHYAAHCAPPVLLARLFGGARKLVVHTHGSDVVPEQNASAFFNYLKVTFARALLRRADMVVTPSPYYRDVVLGISGLNDSRVLVSPSGGVDLSVFYPKDKRPRRKGVKLAFVGRLTEDKGTLDFLDMLLALREKGVLVEAVVVGDGPQSKAVESAARRDEVLHYRFLEQPKLAEVYRDIDLFVFPTRRDSESLGLVGLEAMACGTPVLAYDGSGPETYIENGVNGYLVPRGNSQRLAKVVEAFGQLPTQKRDAMSERAVERAQHYCSEKTHRALSEALVAAAETVQLPRSAKEEMQ